MFKAGLVAAVGTDSRNFGSTAGKLQRLGLSTIHVNPFITHFGRFREADDLPAAKVPGNPGDCRAAASLAAENLETLHQFRLDGGDCRLVGRGFLLPAGRLPGHLYAGNPRV